MKKSEVYTKAAIDIAEKNEHFSCLAIARCQAWGLEFDALYDFEIMFEHHPQKEHGWWNSPALETYRMCRSLALLFMAEIAREEENA